jgi:hypothetical protein
MLLLKSGTVYKLASLCAVQTQRGLSQLSAAGVPGFFCQNSKSRSSPKNPTVEVGDV